MIKKETIDNMNKKKIYLFFFSTKFMINNLMNKYENSYRERERKEEIERI